MDGAHFETEVKDNTNTLLKAFLPSSGPGLGYKNDFFNSRRFS